MVQDEKSIVTPWEVSGDLDYAKLIKKFGTKPFDETLTNKLAKLTGGDIHPMIRRGLVFSHRDFDWLLSHIESGGDFALYTGRGPSGDTHLGHLVPWFFTKWLQDKFDVELYFQITDDEKFLYNPQYTYDQTIGYAYKNIEDILAVGFDPEKTKFIIDSQAGPKFRKLATEISKRITFSTVKAIFGYNESTNIGLLYHPAIQAAPCFYPSIIHGRKIPVLIPAGIDQDPYWRATRDIAKKMGYYKPVALHSEFIPGLEKGGKMSSSNPNSTVFTTDTGKVASKKVNRAFTGGRATIEEQKRLGGDPGICNVFSWYRSSFEEDDTALQKRWDDCKNGDLMCGPCKMDLADRVVLFLEMHQSKKEDVADLIESSIIRV
ncbi:MAG: tryptophan--tRNA ligase [Candidatus Heimdallarchaeota archaeon]|nr:tryptophan--tRNA ligase [Candidatus Heimdallarchaeota archaeon]